MESIGKFVFTQQQEEELQSIVLEQVKLLIPTLFELLTPIILNYTQSVCTEYLTTQPKTSTDYREIEEIVKQNRKDFNAAIDKREKLFHQSHRASRLLDLYKEGLEEEVPFVPRKFRNDKIHMRDRNETPVIQKLNLQRCLAECEILRIRTDNFNSEIEHIDKEVIATINNLTDNNQVATEIIKRYNNFISLDENDIIRKWDKKIESLKKAFKRDRDENTTKRSDPRNLDNLNGTIIVPETQQHHDDNFEETTPPAGENISSVHVLKQRESATKNLPTTRASTRKKNQIQQ